MKIFGGYPLSEFLEQRRQTVAHEIQNDPHDHLLNVNEADYANYLVQKYHLEPVTFAFDATRASSTEKPIPAENHPPLFHVQPGQNYSRQLITLHVPFTGDPELLHCWPSTRITWTHDVTISGRARSPLPRGEGSGVRDKLVIPPSGVRDRLVIPLPRAVETQSLGENEDPKLEQGEGQTGSEIQFDLINWHNNPETLQREKQKILDNITQQNAHVTEEVTQFNSRLEDFVRQTLSSRKSQLLTQLNLAGSLGIPAADVPQTFAVPIVPKKLIVKNGRVGAPSPTASQNSAEGPSLSPGERARVRGKLLPTSPPAFPSPSGRGVRGEGQTSNPSVRGEGQTGTPLSGTHWARSEGQTVPPSTSPSPSGRGVRGEGQTGNPSPSGCGDEVSRRARSQPRARGEGQTVPPGTSPSPSGRGVRGEGQTGNPSPPDPTLDQETYQNILGIIHDLGVAMERQPSTYANKHEQDLRDLFLATLSTHYPSTTGETFNKKGRTDILVRHQGANVFVAECKFWGGLKIFHTTIDQLLSYLTWRDSKAALICFVQNNQLGPVLQMIATGAPQHPCFIRLESTRDESWSQFEFRLPSDPSRNVHLTVLTFHFPPTWVDNI